MADERETPASDSQSGGLSKEKILMVAATFYRRLFQIISYLPVLMIVFGAIVLAYPHRLRDGEYRLHPFHWFPRITASVFFAGLVCFAWNWSIPRNTSRTLKVTFLSVSLLMNGIGVQDILIASCWNPMVHEVVIFSVVAQALCYWWVIPWLEIAARVIKITTATFLPDNRIVLLIWTMASALIHSVVLIAGIEGATLVKVNVAGNMWDSDSAFIVAILAAMTYSIFVVAGALVGTIAILARQKKMLQELIKGCNLQP